MNYFDMDVPWLEHFVDHKLLIEAMTPNRSPCPGRCMSREMCPGVQGEMSKGPRRCMPREMCADEVP